MSRFALPMILLLAVALPGAAAAQATSASAVSEKVRLTFEEALAKAGAEAPSVLSAAAQTAVAAVRVEDAGVALRPTLSASAGLNTGASKVSRSIEGAGLPVSSGDLESETLSLGASATLTARWLLWDFGRTALSEEALEASRASASSDERAARRSATLLVSGAYLAVLADEESVASARATLEHRTRQQEIASRRVKAEMAAPIEETRASVAVAVARGELARAEGQLRRDIAQLAGALGLSPSTELELFPVTFAPVVMTEAEAGARAVSMRPEVAAAAARVEAASLAAAASGAAQRPTLLLTGSIGPDWSETDAPSSQTSAGANAGILLSLPLLDPSTAAATRLAEAQRAAAMAGLEQVRQAVATEAVSAVIEARQAAESLSIAEQTARLAAANLAQAEGRYAAGAAPLMELLDAQIQDSQARQSLVLQRYQAGRSQVALAAATGDFDLLQEASPVR